MKKILLSLLLAPFLASADIHLAWDYDDDINDVRAFLVHYRKSGTTDKIIRIERDPDGNLPLILNITKLLQDNRYLWFYVIVEGKNGIQSEPSELIRGYIPASATGLHIFIKPKTGAEFP